MDNGEYLLFGQAILMLNLIVGHTAFKHAQYFIDCDSCSSKNRLSVPNFLIHDNLGGNTLISTT